MPAKKHSKKPTIADPLLIGFLSGVHAPSLWVAARCGVRRRTNAKITIVETLPHATSRSGLPRWGAQLRGGRYTPTRTPACGPRGWASRSRTAGAAGGGSRAARASVASASALGGLFGVSSGELVVSCCSEWWLLQLVVASMRPLLPAIKGRGATPEVASLVQIGTSRSLPVSVSVSASGSLQSWTKVAESTLAMGHNAPTPAACADAAVISRVVATATATASRQPSAQTGRGRAHSRDSELPSIDIDDLASQSQLSKPCTRGSHCPVRRARLRLTWKELTFKAFFSR